MVALIRIMLAASLAVALQAAPVTVSGTVVDGNGEPATGRVLISWPSFVSADGSFVAAGTKTVSFTGGALSLALEPNVGATPSGTSYTLRFSGAVMMATEYWVVPASGPATIAEVRTSIPPTPSATINLAALSTVGGSEGQVIRLVGGVPTWATMSGGGGGGAPDDAAYWLSSSHLDLPNGVVIATLENLETAISHTFFDGTWANLSGKPSTFAPAAHALIGSAHTVAGLTTGHVLSATSATTAAFGALAASQIPALDASKITSGELAADRISESSVTQHEAALTITENQISDLSHTVDTTKTIQDEGTPLTQRATLNFTGGGVACVDNAGQSRTDCTISGGGGGGGLDDAYSSITDGTNTASASGADTFKLRSANNLLTIAVQSNDGTHGDNALYTINQGNLALAWSQITSGIPTSFTPEAHAASHEDGGSDELEIDWSQIVDAPSTYAPTAHASSHEDGGADELDLAQIDGTLDISNQSNLSADGQGIELTGDQLSLELDGSSLVKSGSGVKISDSYNAPTATALAANPAALTSGKYCANLAADGTCEAEADLDDLDGQVASTQIEDGAVTPAKAAAALKTHTLSWGITDPATGDSDALQWLAPAGVTITAINCSTDTGTVDILLEERALATPNTAGTDVMAAALECDSDNAQQTSFSNAGIASGALLSLTIDAVDGAAMLRVHITYAID
jgi:hypothetical protein